MKIKDLFLISSFLSLFILSSCRDDNFLNFEDAQKFSASASISALEAREILKNNLNKINKDIRQYPCCFIKGNEYYFLRGKPHRRSMYGYKVSATNGMMREVYNCAVTIRPYTYQEQQLLFVDETKPKRSNPPPRPAGGSN